MDDSELVAATQHVDSRANGKRRRPKKHDDKDEDFIEGTPPVVKLPRKTPKCLEKPPTKEQSVRMGKRKVMQWQNNVLPTYF